ncbi:uncharacterized protein LOC134212309 isoform X3 [Armigeres subalbatus]|uniref:uncharacterized protein LOC134212309 isoform X3 n=1 Tax=Armigeres subalbatus TaxID=124917 RepID=UPI002ED01A28
MATQTIPSPQPGRNAAANPQLKSLVYSKYRELLGSYNGKANEILQSYPAYMVKEDKGFDFVDNYGGAPQSTIGNSARRIQAQLPAEPPACVQNAMMRRDKQPFTYTPGGIDLSQIKSPRMAKRISRNAQSEGVSTQPKVSPLAQNNSNSSSSQQAVSPAATLGAAAMGMPFQVFPTGPPAPPPPPPPNVGKKPTIGQTNGNSASAPPPPPPPVPSLERKTPKPQTFEPPPMGCRPEIKIPPNPMANLRKAPRPQPKNDFWIEEYRNERRNDLPNPAQQLPVYNTREADEEVAKNTHNRTDQLTVRNGSPNRSPSPSNLTKPLENGSHVSSIKTPPVYSQSPVPPNLPPPITPTKLSQPPSSLAINSTAKVQQLNKEQSPKTRHSSPPSSSPPSPPNNGTNYTDTSANNNSTTVKPPTSQKPAPQALGSLYIPPPHEAFANSKQSLLNQTSPPWMSSRQNSAKEQPEWVHKEDPDFLGSKQSSTSKSNSNETATKTSEPIATAPPSPPKPAPAPKQQQAPQSTTIVSRPQTIELSPPTQPATSQTHYIQLQNPVAKVTPQPIVQQAPPVAMQTVRNYPQAPVYVQNQMYSPQPAANQKERIIPIQIEQSPIKTPVSAPSFAPPPYYSPGPQYNPVQSPLTVGYPGPHSGFTTPTAMFTNPNHFVNQGYNNISYPPTSPQHPMYQQHHQHYQQPSPSVQQQQQQHQQMMHQQRMQQQTPTQQPGGVRIIPIKVENNDNGTTATTVRGPLSQTPAIIQSGDHRYIIHDIPLEAKLRFLKNRLSDPRSHNNPQAWNGNSAPNQSRSFRVLQHITDTMEDAESRSNPSTPKPSSEQQIGNHVEGAESQLRSMQLSKDDKALMNRVKNQGSTNRTNQMFVQNRGNATESEDETAQQYIPPSEQRVEEPKKYTGSAIPSRSFKMLQAMTQSDAPAETNSSDTEGNQNLPCNGEVQYSPYPYSLQPHYCCNPNWHYYDPNNPQYYPHPPPPPPHHLPGYYYPPPPPHPPHGHYDRNSYYASYMSPHHFYYPQEPCSPCTPPPYYQIGQPQIAYCENVVPDSPTHSYIISTPPPRLIVTPTPDPADSDVESILSDNPIHPLTRSQSSLQHLSDRLANFSASPEKIFPNDSETMVRCSPSSPLNERYRTFEESTSSAPSSQSECSDSEEEGHNKQAQNTVALAQKEPAQNGTNGHEEHTEQEEEESSEESEDEATVGYDSNPQEHLPHQLSVIFEEESVYSCSANTSRRASVCSNSSTLSDCSSTLANDLDEADGHSHDIDSVKLDCGNQTDDDIDRLDDYEYSANEQTGIILEETPLDSDNRDKINTSDDSTSEAESEEESTTDEEEEADAVVDDCVHKNEAENTALINTEEGLEELKHKEVESSETEESESESDEEEETTDDEMHTDVTVTITIPSMSSKSLNDLGKESNSIHKENEESRPTFTVDYEEDSNVSVSVSLPLKVKPITNEDVNEEEAKINHTDMQEELEEVNDEDDDEEIDFWSQIGEEDETSRPSRSFSRDFWSSREASVDRDGELNPDIDGGNIDDEDTDFWSSENCPTEAIDLWKKDSIVESFLDRQKNENTNDTLDFWHSENERMFDTMYSKKDQNDKAEKDSAPIDENNNTSTWQKLEKSVDKEPEVNELTNNDRDVSNEATLQNESEDAETETESSQEESEDDSEDYETTNTSKEESDAEENEKQTGNKIQPEVTEQKAPEIVLKRAPVTEKIEHKCNGMLDAINTTSKEDDKKLSVRDRISIFENQTSKSENRASTPLLEVPVRQKTSDSCNRSRPSSIIKMSAEESEFEDDSGMTSDVSKQISEVETDTECFPEMRKMTRYQRAATHSRLFKLLQDESNNGDSDDENAERLASIEHVESQPANEEQTVVHPRHSSLSKYKDSSFDDSSSASNTASDRRDRLSLPIRHQSSSGIESMSSSTSSASPVSGATNEKLAEELVQSLLMKKKGRLFRNLPLDKLHAAAMKILQEDLESNGTLSSTEDNITVDSTPALTPQEFKTEYQNSYADYYDTWNESNGKNSPLECTAPDALPSKAFRSLQDTVNPATRKANGWSARCPRVLSSKSISRLADVRETDSEPSTYSRSRPQSRASNQSPYPTLSGLIEESACRSKSPFKQSKFSHF